MHPLDEALELSLHGNQDESFSILSKFCKQYPYDERAAFNLGWHEMKQGNLLTGHKYLTRGRLANVFGNKHIGSSKPFWNGERGVTVLMEMEGGLGDQIHAIRYAKDIANYGNKVIISGSEHLAEIMIDCEGVSAFCQHEVATGIYHDYWIPSMSVTIPLGYEFKDISGEPYIRKIGSSDRKVGVKWSGNPVFEHQQHRLFPSQLMFDTVNDEDCISLQKKDGETDGNVDSPSWMEQPSLDTWKDTQRAISLCDLVITSCTGVAHLSAAMGIETWVVVPILSYYLWALPGNKTPYYNSVTLFRQEKYGCWEAPFKKIKQTLTTRRISKREKLPMGESTLSFVEA